MGTKLSKTFTDGDHTESTDYIGGMHYKDETLDFVQHTEGRYMFGTAKFQYDLKDHLGNVRVTVEGKTDQPAPITTSYSMGSSESPSFPTNPNAYFVTSPKYEGSHALKVRGSGGMSSSVLSVAISEGQEFSVSVMASSTYNSGKLQIKFRPTGSYSRTTLEEISKRLPYGGRTWLELSSSTLTAPADGTIEIRLIKPTSYSDVYYDKLTIKVQGELLAAEDITVVQKDDYYPFGMAFNSITTSGDENLYKYNGKEEQKETGWYDYHARQYASDIARWMVIDPEAKLYYPWSPYNYVLGNPIKNIDPDGKVVGTVIGAVIGGAYGAYQAYQTGGSVAQAITEGAVSGAISGAAVDIAVAATVATGGAAAVVIAGGVAAAGGALGAVAGDAAGQVATQVVDQGKSIGDAAQNISTENFVDKAVTGAVSGAVGGAAGAAVGKGLQAAANSTKAVQGAMSKNITTTAKVLNKMGADAKTITNATSKITNGMGQAGKTTVENSLKVSAGAGTVIESAIKVTNDKIDQ